MRCTRCEAPLTPGLLRCRSCRYWNASAATVIAPPVLRLSDAKASTTARYDVGPINRVLGGGLARTSMNLLGGEPGAGKSTLLLQLCDFLAASTDRDVVYACAEQIPDEIRGSAERLKLENIDRLVMINLMGAVREEAMFAIQDVVHAVRPVACIVDSLPAVMGRRDHDGAVTFCERLKLAAVAIESPFVVIDHITKDHGLAGLMSLQHVVDAVATLEIRDAKDGFRRVWTTLKNRNGPNGVQCLTMTDRGLVARAACAQGAEPCSVCGRSLETGP